MTKHALVMALIIGAISAHAQDAVEDTGKLFSSTFSEIRKHHYVNSQYAFFTVTNIGQRDIDDVVLSLSLLDSQHEALSRNAVNVITPGLVWLKAGESIELGVPLDDHPDAKTLMTENPNSASLQIEVRSITFMDEHKSTD